MRSRSSTAVSPPCWFSRLVNHRLSGVTVSRLRLKHVPFGNGIGGLALPGSLEGLAELLEQVRHHYHKLSNDELSCIASSRSLKYIVLNEIASSQAPPTLEEVHVELHCWAKEGLDLGPPLSPAWCTWFSRLGDWVFQPVSDLYTQRNGVMGPAASRIQQGKETRHGRRLYLDTSNLQVCHV